MSSPSMELEHLNRIVGSPRARENCRLGPVFWLLGVCWYDEDFAGSKGYRAHQGLSSAFYEAERLFHCSVLNN